MIRKTLHTVEMPIDAAKFRLKRRFNLFDPIHILAYRGFGNSRRAQVLGRVVEDREIGNADHDDPWWKNALAVKRRFTTDEIPGVRVQASFQDQTAEMTTDNEGYFHFQFDLDQRPPADELWHEVEVAASVRIRSSMSFELVVVARLDESAVISVDSRDQTWSRRRFD